MARVGRKPKSAHQRALEGSGPARRVVSDTIICDVSAEMPDCVADDPVAAEAWQRLVDVAPAGLLCALDEALLTVYAESMSLRQRMLADITTNGILGKRGGKNPSLSTLKSANDAVLRCLNMMGLAPVDRSRLDIPKPPAAPSKFGDLLKQRV